MRSLRKSTCPAILDQSAEAWTREILDALQQGIDPSPAQKRRYNQPEIKSALLAETHSKCAYCESKVRHISHGDIEHMIAKSKVPERAFDWGNLTIACRICNQNKGDFHEGIDDHSGLVDPYEDDPEDHFMFHRELVTPRPDSDKALKTEDVLKLMRGDLLERRKERMDFVDGLVRAYLSAAEDVRPLLRRNIYKRCAGDEAEYVAIVRHYLSDLEGRSLL